MKNSVTKVIKDNIELINNNDFLNFFSEVYYEDIPEIVDILQTAHIDFLKYMNRIPQLCFKGSKKIQNITIPSKYARRLPLVTEVEFNNNYDKNLKIGYQAFDGCPNLTSVKLTKRMVLSQFVFHDCKKLQTVIYPDTLECFNMFVTAYDFSFDNDTVITFDDCDMDWKTLIKLRSQIT